MWKATPGHRRLGFGSSCSWIQHLPCAAQSCSKERMSLCSCAVCQFHGAFLGEMGELDGFWSCFVVWFYFEILALWF